MTTWSEYVASTGIFTGRRIETDDVAVAAINVSDGCGLALGSFDPDTQYVVTSDGSVASIDAAALARYTARPAGRFWAWDKSSQQWVDRRTLDEARRQRVAEIKSDGLSRINTRFGAIDSFDTLKLVREVMLSIAPAARQLTANFQWLSDTYQAGTDAISAVQSATTIAQVDAVTPAWPAL